MTALASHYQCVMVRACCGPAACGYAPRELIATRLGVFTAVEETMRQLTSKLATVDELLSQSCVLFLSCLVLVSFEAQGRCAPAIQLWQKNSLQTHNTTHRGGYLH
jgi:hypothetical protein